MQNKQNINKLRKKLIIITIILIGIISLGAFFWWDDYSFYNIPIHVFNIENKNNTYTITYDKKSGAYLITLPNTNQNNYNPVAWISSSPKNLDQFVNKKVKVTGK